MVGAHICSFNCTVLLSYSCLWGISLKQNQSCKISKISLLHLLLSSMSFPHLYLSSRLVGLFKLIQSWTLLSDTFCEPRDTSRWIWQINILFSSVELRIILLIMIFPKKKKKRRNNQKLNLVSCQTVKSKLTGLQVGSWWFRDLCCKIPI